MVLFFGGVIHVSEKFQIQKPLAIANFVVQVAKDANHPVTNLKLQKVLFFLQGYFLSKHNKALLDGTFSKWQYGPVIEEIYQEFKYLGASPINSKSTQLCMDNEKIEFYSEEVDLPNNLTNEVEEVIKQIIKKEPWQLVQLTHSDSSWKNYEDKIRKRVAEDYTNEEIKNCFEASREELGV